MSTDGFGASRAGGEGLHNEDVFLVDEGLGLYVVCDGASGTPAGEVAARRAADAVEDFVERIGADFRLASEPVARHVVEEAMRHALTSAQQVSQDDHPATTVTMLLAHGDHGVIGHWGDSRAYLLRRDRALQLTRDHELTEATAREAADRFDIFSIDLEPGDLLVLCTDGAEDVMQDRAILRSARDVSPHVLASRIVATANDRNPQQDATAVVVRVRGRGEPGWLELSRLPQATRVGHALEPLDARARRRERAKGGAGD